MLGVLGGGADREGKVFMRGGAERKVKLDSGSLIMTLINKAGLQVLYCRRCWLGEEHVASRLPRSAGSLD